MSYNKISHENFKNVVLFFATMKHDLYFTKYFATAVPKVCAAVSEYLLTFSVVLFIVKKTGLSFKRDEKAWEPPLWNHVQFR